MISKKQLDKYEQLLNRSLELIREIGFSDEETVGIEVKYMTFVSALIAEANAAPVVTPIPNNSPITNVDYPAA